MSSKGRNWTVIVPVALLCLSTLMNAWFLLVQRGYQPTLAPERVYSWNGSDFPPSLPLDLSETFDHAYTDHLDYFGLLEDIQSNTAWGSLRPPGIGFLHLGPGKRPFGLSMIHSIHCLLTIRETLQQGKDPQGPYHLSHCMNYLLHGVLCAADVTLEPSTENEVMVNGTPIIIPQLSPHTTHECRDWTRVYKYLQDDFWKNSDVASLFRQN